MNFWNFFGRAEYMIPERTILMSEFKIVLFGIEQYITNQTQISRVYSFNKLYSIYLPTARNETINIRLRRT